MREVLAVPSAFWVKGAVLLGFEDINRNMVMSGQP